MPRSRLRVGWPGNFREIEANTPDGDPAPWDADSKLSVVGSRMPRVEGPEKVTGRARYTSDIHLPGMLEGAVLRSPHAHARATIDLVPALSLPGVFAAITLETEPRFAGQAVAAVAAETGLRAQEALEAIRVTWEVLPHVAEAEDARKPGAPKVLGGRNENARTSEGDGSRPEADCQRALEAAAASIDLTFRTPVVEHTCLESHGSVAVWDASALTVYDSTQAVSAVRDGLARSLQIPANDVRVLKEHMGGGFGSKLGMGETALIAARLAKAAGRPVKVLNDRRAEQATGGNRPSSIQRLRLGASGAGVLSVMWLESSGTGGVGGGAGCSGPFRSLYRAPIIRDEHTDILTNAGRAQAFRAPGHVQGMFALESAIDALAEKAGIDPLQFRLRNDGNDLRKAQYEEGARRIGWERRDALRGASGPRKARGLGCAASIWGGAGGPGAQARVVIARDGSVEVHCGTQDIGTGTRTILAQIAAEELGVPVSAIRVKLGDTALPWSHGSGGSMTAPSVTPAVRSAAARALRRIFEACAETLGAKAADFRVRDGRVLAEGHAPLDWADACAMIQGASVSESATRERNFEGFRGGTAGCQFADVEVDLETGKIRVLRIEAIHDCGRVVNPLLAESQIQGGILQGLSYALLEQRVLDRASGRQLNANLGDYKIAGLRETPEINVTLFDVSNGLTNTGVMGIGEPPIIPTPAAIANAVSHAIGKRVTELPMTPGSILGLLGESK